MDEVLTLHGYYGAWIRSALKNGDSSAQRQQIQRYLESAGSALLEDLEAENIAEPRKPLVLRVRYRIGGALHEAEERLIGRVPAVWATTC